MHLSSYGMIFLFRTRRRLATHFGSFAPSVTRLNLKRLIKDWIVLPVTTSTVVWLVAIRFLLQAFCIFSPLSRGL